jgi:hypothetical protein
MIKKCLQRLKTGAVVNEILHILKAFLAQLCALSLSLSLSLSRRIVTTFVIFCLSRNLTPLKG